MGSKTSQKTCVSAHSTNKKQAFHVSFPIALRFTETKYTFADKRTHEFCTFLVAFEGILLFRYCEAQIQKNSSQALRLNHFPVSVEGRLKRCLQEYLWTRFGG